MSLYVDDPCFFVPGIVPPELERYLALHEWEDICEKLMRSNEKGQDCACYTEALICVIFPISCPILACCHPLVADICVKLDRKSKCNSINYQYFEGKKIFTCGEKHSVYIHFSLLEEPGVAIEYAGPPTERARLPEAAAAATTTTSAVKVITQQPTSIVPRKSVTFAEDTI